MSLKAKRAVGTGKRPPAGTVVRLGAYSDTRHVSHLVAEGTRRTVCGLYLNIMPKDSMWPGPNWKEETGKATCRACLKED